MNSNGQAGEPRRSYLPGSTSAAAVVLAHPVTLVAAFLATAGFTILHHEMWLDEMNPWVLARDAESLGGLVQNMHYEPHPPLWYLLLYLMTRFTRDPLAMQVLHVIIATAVVAVIAAASPFRRVEQWLIAFGYFFVFEYAVISRSYGLGLLLLFTACSLYVRPRPPLLLVAACLALLANTTAYGCYVALAFGAGIVADIAWSTGRRTPMPHFLGSALIFLTGIGVSGVTTYPPADLMFARGWNLELDGSRLAGTLNLIWAAHVPLPDLATSSPWNSSVILRLLANAGALPTGLVAAGGVALIAAIGRALRHDRLAVVLYVGTSVMVLLFIYLKFTPGMRHHGHMFIALVAAVWVYRRRNPGGNVSAIRAPGHDRAGWRWLTSVLLVSHVIAGTYFIIQDIRRPFSFSKDLAGFVGRLPRRTPVVIAQPRFMNYAGPVLSGYLRRPLHYVLARRVVRMGFAIWDDERFRGATEGQIIEQLRRFADARATDVFVVTNNWDTPSLGTRLAHFPEGACLQKDERSASVYLFRRQSSRR